MAKEEKYENVIPFDCLKPFLKLEIGGRTFGYSAFLGICYSLTGAFEEKILTIGSNRSKVQRHFIMDLINRL